MRTALDGREDNGQRQAASEYGARAQRQVRDTLVRCWERGEDQGQRRRAALEKTALREREDEARHRERIGWTDGTVDGWMGWRGMFDGPI